LKFFFFFNFIQFSMIDHPCIFKSHINNINQLRTLYWLDTYSFIVFHFYLKPILHMEYITKKIRKWQILGAEWLWIFLTPKWLVVFFKRCCWKLSFSSTLTKFENKNLTFKIQPNESIEDYCGSVWTKISPCGLKDYNVWSGKKLLFNLARQCQLTFSHLEVKILLNINYFLCNSEY